jgi:hypothetical protein
VIGGSNGLAVPDVWPAGNSNRSPVHIRFGRAIIEQNVKAKIEQNSEILSRIAYCFL